MTKKFYILSLLLVASAVQVFAQQKTDRDYLRSGNKLYNDSLFIKAEVDYRKALEINPKSTDAMFNLANTLLMQQKAKEAMEQYESVSKIEKDKDKLAQIYHNMGVILQSSKQLPQCIEAYKESLRNNPKDNETRYNLALAQKQLKDQQQNQQNQDQQQQQQQKQEEEKQDQNKDQQEQEQKDQQQQNQQQQQNKNEMSKENAQQLLNAVMQDEKNVQDKVLPGGNRSWSALQRQVRLSSPVWTARRSFRPLIFMICF